MSNSRRIETRSDLFAFLQTQMHKAYRELRDSQRLQSESTLIKSYIFEVDLPDYVKDCYESPQGMTRFIAESFGVQGRRSRFAVTAKDEPGFFEVSLSNNSETLVLYLDTATNPRFWLGFSMSKAVLLDRWFESVIRTRTEFDFVWLWPTFLERIQLRGVARGFGLDFDHSKFGIEDSEGTTYLKMQLWGDEQTNQLYDLLRDHRLFGGKTVLAKVRLKEVADSQCGDAFAIQDVKYNGKFTTRGSDFTTHAATLSAVRAEYEQTIRNIEETCTLRWKQSEHGSCVLEGYAVNFIPAEDYRVPVASFCDRALDGTLPFRLLGFSDITNGSCATAEVVDLHTGGKLFFEVHPDVITVYLTEGTCGNTIARLYANLQHCFDARFQVETDDGRELFQLPLT